jgi:hypothetical protein
MEFHDLYSSPDDIRIIKFRRIRCVGHVSLMGEKRNIYKISIGNPEGKIPLNVPQCR